MLTASQQTVLDNINLARERISAKIAEISENPMTSYVLDGQMFSWTEYFAALTNRLEELDKAAQRRGNLLVLWLGKDVTTIVGPLV